MPTMGMAMSGGPFRALSTVRCTHAPDAVASEVAVHDAFAAEGDGHKIPISAVVPSSSEVYHWGLPASSTVDFGCSDRAPQC